MIYRLQKYKPKFRYEWDNLVRRSKNGTFLFFRDYLEYHAEKFEECSFLFMRKNRVIAVLPGNIDGVAFWTHKYLTYGGLICGDEVKATVIIELFDLLNAALKELGVTEVFYKPVPYIYHTQPSQEELYAMFRLKAVKIGCQLSSAIYSVAKVKYSKSRIDGIKKARKSKISVKESEDFTHFWEILSTNLKEKYNTKPVHTLSEIEYLKNKFPDNIKLFEAIYDGRCCAGVVVYQYKRVHHMQYIATSETGKMTGALDILFDELINVSEGSYSVFDFGYSTEKMGELLNENLIFQKEGFGARGVVYEVYKYTT